MYKVAALADTVYFWFGANDTSGSGGDGATPAADVRLAGAAADAIPTLSPTPVLLSHANYPAGCYEVAVAATAANGFASGNEYAIFCTLLIDSQNPTGFVGSFSLVAAGDSLLSAAARTMDAIPNAAAGAVGGIAIVGSEVDLVDAPNATAVTAIQSGLSTLTAAQVDTECDEALTNYDPPTKAELDSGLAGLNDLTAAAVNTEVDSALSDIDLDHLLKVAHPTGDPVADTIADLLMNKGAGQTFTRGTDSLEALRDTAPMGSAMVGTDGALTDKAGFSLSVAGILAIWHQLVANIVTASTIGKLLVDNINATIGSRGTADPGDQMDLQDAPNSTAVTAIQSGLAQTGADSDTLKTISDQLDNASTHDAAAVWAVGTRTLTSLGSSAIASIWNALTSGFTTVGSIGKLLVDNVDDPISGATAPTVEEIDTKLADEHGSGSWRQGGAGAGAITSTYTLYKTGTTTPVVEADVWVTSDEAGDSVEASGETDANGQVVFYLDAGTHYVWRQKAGFNFTNPETWEVSA